MLSICEGSFPYDQRKNTIIGDYEWQNKVRKQEHKSKQMNRIETQLKTIEPIRIIKESIWID